MILTTKEKLEILWRIVGTQRCFRECFIKVATEEITLHAEIIAPYIYLYSRYNIEDVKAVQKGPFKSWRGYSTYKRALQAYRSEISLYSNPYTNLYLGVTSYLNRKFPQRRHTLVDGFILTQTR